MVIPVVGFGVTSGVCRWQRVGSLKVLPVCKIERVILMSCRQRRRTRVMTNMTRRQGKKKVREKTPDGRKNASHMRYNVKSCATECTDGNYNFTEDKKTRKQKKTKARQHSSSRVTAESAQPKSLCRCNLTHVKHVQGQRQSNRKSVWGGEGSK